MGFDRKFCSTWGPVWRTLAMGLLVLISTLGGCSKDDPGTPEDDDDESSGGSDSNLTSGGKGNTGGEATGSGGFPTSGGSQSTGGSSGSGASANTGAMGGVDGMGGAENPDDVDGPRLLSLTVESIASELNPPFSPEVHRYSVRANDPIEPLKVAATATAGAEILIDGHVLEGADPVELEAIQPGDEVSVVVESQRGDTTTYTIVYLPNVFPDLRTTILTAKASRDPVYLTLTGFGANFLAKVDVHGVPLFFRQLTRGGFDFKGHPDGRMTYAYNLGSQNFEQVFLDGAYEESARIRTVGLQNTNNHDFKILENGNFVLMAYEPAVRDLTPFGGPGAVTLADGILQEITPDGEVQFQWNVWDHTSYDESADADFATADYAHLNSLEVGADGSWLVSARLYNQVLKVDRQSGEVSWKLGGLSNDFTFTNDAFEGPCAQHTASWTSPNRVLLFDNGQNRICPNREEKFTRVVEYELDDENWTAEIVWSYQPEGVFSSSQGSAQRLANGNTFIGWGSFDEILATEVAPNGDVVLEMKAQSPRGPVNSYRALKLAD